MKNKIVLLEKTYEGFEDVYDLDRDVSEIWDFPQNPEAKKIPGEFEGQVKVTITYVPTEDENKMLKIKE